MNNKLPTDGARYKSFMAKTQLLQTESDEPSKQGASRWLRKHKSKKKHEPPSPVTVRLETEIPKIMQTSRINVSKTKDDFSRTRLQRSIDALPIKLCEQLLVLPEQQKASFAPVLPIRQKIKLYQKHSVDQLPSLTGLRRTIIHECNTPVKTRSRSKKLYKHDFKPSRHEALTPLLKYRHNSSNKNISQLNRLVTEEVFYKLRYTRACEK